jgi:hypothetical protein
MLLGWHSFDAAAANKNFSLLLGCLLSHGHVLSQGGGPPSGLHTMHQPNPHAQPPRPQVATHAVRKTQTIKNQVNLM